MVGRNLSLLESTGVVLVLSFIATVISKYVENTYPFHKKKCSNDICPTLGILSVRFLHYFITFLLLAYIPLFNPTYDIYYIILYACIILHWVIFDFCYLSNLEISLYEDNVSIGDHTLLHPHLRVFAGDNTDYIVFMQLIVMTLSFLYILYRMDPHPFKILFGITLLVIQFTVVIKSRMHTFL